MENNRPVIYVLTDDPRFLRRLRRSFEAKFSGVDFLVYGRNLSICDFSISNFFPHAIEKTKPATVIVDFDNEYLFKRDMIKIMNKYPELVDVPKIAIFGEEHDEQDLSEVYSLGVILTDYKREDVDDLVCNLNFLVKKEFVGAPRYAKARGFNEVIWPKFLCSISEVYPDQVIALSKFDKIQPSEKWINEFLPTLKDNKYALSDDLIYRRKMRWVEDINLLNSKSLLPEGLSDKKVNIKKIDNGDKNSKHSKLVFERRIDIDKKEQIIKASKKTISYLQKNPLVDQTRIVVIDKYLRLLRKFDGYDKGRGINILSYPYLKDDLKNLVKIKPEILVVHVDALEIINDEGEVIRGSNNAKVNYFLKEVEKRFKVKPCIVFLNSNLEINTDLKVIQFPSIPDIGVFERFNSIYLAKKESCWREDLCKNRNESLSNYEIDMVGIKREFFVEVPIIIDEMSEHVIKFKAPMNLKDGQVIKIDESINCFVTVFKDLSEKDTFFGVINGATELQRAKIRQYVNQLISIPNEREKEKEKQEFFQLNINKMVEAFRKKGASVS